MSLLQVNVSGYFNETYVGNDAEVEKYLIGLKKLQLECVSEHDLAFYKKDTKYVTKRGDYNDLITSYFRPSNARLDFRENNKKFGLKIKISKIEDNNEFF